MRETATDWGTDAIEAVSDATGLETTLVTAVAALVALGIVLALTGLVVRRTRRWRSSDVRTSRRRHRQAQSRTPPVDVGDIERLGVQEFTTHHSGERQAVGKVEGFVIFVEGVPADVEVADVLRVKVLSFNRGHTSATATYLGRA